MSMKTEKDTNSLYLIEFLKNGVKRNYQIPASSELNAAVRLGQIFGDDRNYREDLSIEIVNIKKAY